MHSKTCVKLPLKRLDKTKILVTNGSLMQDESIAECSKGSILQYFRPALSNIDHENQFSIFLSVAVLHRFYCTASVNFCHRKVGRVYMFWCHRKILPYPTQICLNFKAIEAMTLI